MAILSVCPTVLFSAPSGGEWLWIVLAIVILFGGKKIPELAKGVGKGIREFNDAKDGIKREIETGMKENNNSSSNTTTTTTTNTPQTNA
jgi:sec-independent protein translocase protein TatA